MGRVKAIFGIWLIGYSLGFIAYLAFPMLADALAALIPFLMSIDSRLVGATVTGLATSLITVSAVAAWAKLTKPKY
ncbi:MAG: hypothetical protein ACK4TI_00250 [Nitrososphaerales archaeon]